MRFLPSQHHLLALSLDSGITFRTQDAYETYLPVDDIDLGPSLHPDSPYPLTCILKTEFLSLSLFAPSRCNKEVLQRSPCHLSFHFA